MTPRVAQVVRVATVLAFLAAGVLLFRFVDREDPYDEPEPDAEAGEVSVAEAIGVAGAEPIAVIGYVFIGPGERELRLCHSRERGDPPRCIGPFISLVGVDEGAFHVDSGVDDEEGPVRWSPDQVIVQGRLIGTLMRVEVVLG